MPKKPIKSLEQVAERIKDLKLPKDIDLVVGIARGGVVPAYLIAHHLGVPVEFLWFNFRDEHHDPHRPKPIQLRPVNFDFSGKRILLVDDRINSGKTVDAAKGVLKKAASVRTAAVNGRADFSLFDEECFVFPWNIGDLKD